MPAFQGQLAEARRRFQDPHQLLRKLRMLVVPDEGDRSSRRHWGTLGPVMRDEQVALDVALARKNKVFVLKCRRLGITTFCKAYLFAKAYGAPKSAPRTTLSMGHAPIAINTMNRMVREFHRGLPGPLRSSLRPDNELATGFSHNGSLMLRDLAGGKGEGRSGGVTDVHFTEMAFYKAGTAERGRENGNADREMYQSVMASHDDPNGSVIVESTGNGPRGLFYDLHKTAMASDEWEFMFFPWHHFQRYSRPFLKRSDSGELVPDEAAERQFAQDLTDFERDLMDKHSLSLSQVRWMRLKLQDEGYEWLRFLKEYPFTELDPFLLDQAGWFDQGALQAHMELAVGRAGGDQLQVYRGLEYDSTRRYYMGVDTSGGAGRDEAVIQIVRDDFAHCLTWRSNTANPYQQAEMVCALGAAWGQPLTLIEANKYGRLVIQHVKRIGGVKLWEDQDSKDGNFWMNGGPNSNTKREVYDFAQQMIDREWCVIHHPETVVQAQQVVSKPSGKIEAQSGNDDLIDAFALALWCARRQARRAARVEDDRAIHRRRMELMRAKWGPGHEVYA